MSDVYFDARQMVPILPGEEYESLAVLCECCAIAGILHGVQAVTGNPVSAGALEQIFWSLEPLITEMVEAYEE